MKLLVCVLLFDLAATEPSPSPAATAPPHAPSGLRWLPRLTLRFTHRGAAARWAESLDDARSVPLGTTLELRLEWALDTSILPGAPTLSHSHPEDL